MDNEEIQGVKFSEFPSATPGNSDEVVGLHSGDNARFTIANIIAAIRQGLANIFVPKTDVGAAGGVASLDSTGKVPTSQLPTSTGPEPATATPLMDGTGAVGVSTKYAREDHEHPADTNKQNKITASGILKGDGAGGVSAATAGTDYQAPLTAGTDYATPGQLADKANPGQIGYPETGTTASRNYTAGEYICWNGLTYTADTNIALGATLSASGGNKNLTECVGGGLNTLRSAIGVTTSASLNQYIDGYGSYVLNLTPPKTGAIPFACGLTSAFSWFKGSFGVITDGNNGSPGILITNLESSRKRFEGTFTVYWITL